MSEVPDKQFAKSFPVSYDLDLRGHKITLAPPNFSTLGALEEEFGEDWDVVLGRIDIKDRKNFIKLFTILAKQTYIDFTEEMAWNLIDTHNMWQVVEGMQEVISKSQPSPDFLKKLQGTTNQDES